MDKWLAGSAAAGIDAFVALRRRIVKHKDSILAPIKHGLRRIELVNTRIRVARIAFEYATLPGRT